MIIPIELQLAEQYTLIAKVTVEDYSIDDLIKMSVTDIVKQQPIPQELRDYDDIDPEHGWVIVSIKQLSVGIHDNEILVKIVFERVDNDKTIWLENQKCRYCKGEIKTIQEFEAGLCKWCAGQVADSGC